MAQSPDQLHPWQSGCSPLLRSLDEWAPDHCGRNNIQMSTKMFMVPKRTVKTPMKAVGKTIFFCFQKLALEYQIHVDQKKYQQPAINSSILKELGTSLGYNYLTSFWHHLNTQVRQAFIETFSIRRLTSEVPIVLYWAITAKNPTSDCHFLIWLTSPAAGA